MGSLAKAKAHGLGWLVSKVLPIPVPRVVDGEGSTGKLGPLCKEAGIKKVLLVTDEVLSGLGVLTNAKASLEQTGVQYAVFDKVLPDPTIDMCNDGFAIYQSEKCDGIICFGGGSVMDCAKMIACRATNPSKDAYSFFGTLMLTTSLARVPTLIAVPTTAGTGSECTIAAVISDAKAKQKFTVIDPLLCPAIAVLDPTLIVGLPKPITAATGMDALTHAVESYISGWRSGFSGDASLRAIKAIFGNLVKSCETPTDLHARNEMLKASYDAGLAFTRANVGYVHAIAHQLGGLYHVPHGVANAMILPVILDFYRDTCEEPFAEMALAAGLGTKKEKKSVLADKFVAGVKQMAKDVGIPTFAKGLPASDVSLVAQRAMNEAHGDTYSITEYPLKYMFDTGYPVPKYLDTQKMEEIVRTFVDPQAPLRAAL